MMSAFRDRLNIGTIFNRAAHGGPRRFLIMGAATVALVGGVVAVSMNGAVLRPGSRLARTPGFNALPGGTHSDIQQESLAKQASQEQADAARNQGQSYIPPMPASHLRDPDGAVSPASAARRNQPLVGPRSVGFAPPVPAVHAPAVNQVKPLPVTLRATPPAAGTTTGDPAVQLVAQSPQDQKQEMDGYDKAVKDLLRGWDGRSPNTEVVLSGQPDHRDSRSPNDAAPDSLAARPASLNSNLGGSSSEPRKQIMPAGRGIYAHTVLAVDSDTGGPIVIQADSGPFAGDRMVGSFGKAGGGPGTGTNSDRLVVRVISIEHRGQTLAADGIVIAPDTMETTVASSVDEHYVSRFLLPAAAAFVQGLGSALQTTSNTNGVLSPLGGTSFTEQLNFRQQLGVAAGAAASQAGNTLNQQAPRGPTVHLDANANIGVMFLTPVFENPVR